MVNLPTLPGDVAVGAAVMLHGNGQSIPWLTVSAAGIASIALYMFGLADNDIVGAPSDRGRPIPSGEISLRAAAVARGLCIFAAMIIGAVANLPPSWWMTVFALFVAVVAYNRTKWCWLMGICRGLNVIGGAAALMAGGLGALSMADGAWLAAIFAVWTIYFAIVTLYSEGEELDAEKKRYVGSMVGAVVYLQIMALIGFMVVPLLAVGGVMLIALRLAKRSFKEVSAS